MEDIFPYFIFAAMLATLGVLGAGLVNMFRRDKNSKIRSNNLMRWRVILQGVALILFAVFIFLFK